MEKNNMIFVIVIFIIGVLLYSAPGVYASRNFQGNQFFSHTYVGPFNISNNKTKQAKSKLASEFSELQSELEVNLIYQDIQFSLPPETITFDIDMTLTNANSGEDNPIIATVSREGLQTVLSQELPKFRFSKNAIESVAIGIEKELQTGIMPRNVHITDYLKADELQNKVIASSEYSIDGITPALSKAIHALDQSVIGPFESFSMLEVLQSSEVGPLTNQEMTLLSSIVYNAVLQSNFHIDERNISTAITTDIQPGFEAAMNQTLGLDFKFTNPNKTEFTIRAAWSAGAIHVTIEGLPFYYTYEPILSNVETYKPRTVRQYSAFMDQGQVYVSQAGKDGVEAIVKRTLSVGGKVIDTEDISEDFYAPIHRIEIHSLSKENTSVTEADPSQIEGTQSGTSTEISNSGEVETNSSSTIDETGIEPPTGGNIIYDKSGLPISGK